jgi:hypothetical protein
VHGAEDVVDHLVTSRRTQPPTSSSGAGVGFNSRTAVIFAPA